MKKFAQMITSWFSTFQLKHAVLLFEPLMLSEKKSKFIVVANDNITGTFFINPNVIYVATDRYILMRRESLKFVIKWIIIFENDFYEVRVQ